MVTRSWRGRISDACHQVVRHRPDAVEESLCACGFRTGRIIRPSSFSRDAKGRHDKAGTLTKHTPEQNASGYVSMKRAIARCSPPRRSRIAKGPRTHCYSPLALARMANGDGCVLNVLDAMDDPYELVLGMF